MTKVIKKPENEVIGKKQIDEVTKLMLDLPQADCPVAHYFGDRIYIRQVMFPAGNFAIGHIQKYDQMNIFVAGKVAMIQADGTVKEMAAPMVFNGMAGQKMGFILEPVIWLNVYPNPDNCRNIDELESRWLDKSDAWKMPESADRNEDRIDFKNMLKSFNCTEDQVVAESVFDTNLDDEYWTVLSIRPSMIHGAGIFTSWPINKDEIIAPLIIDGKRTTLVKFINHAKDPNTKLVRFDNGDITLLAARDISGCKGGDRGEEITIDYRQYITMRLKK
ncbi:MAG: SET domain-containing protein-lysine N-methyltransferase [Desulfatitalea sp.]|nr:SET domain-containing protein-lysine N-methyltransferase [Desulfatitalea sp.]